MSELGAAVPASLFDDEDSMGARCDRLGDLGQVDTSKYLAVEAPS
jgi:hypothetical protein